MIIRRDRSLVVGHFRFALGLDSDEDLRRW